MTRLLDKTPDTKELQKAGRKAVKQFKQQQAELQKSGKQAAGKASKQVKHSAKRAKDSDITESVVAGVGAILPFLSSRVARRTGAKGVRMAPVLVRTHPVLMVFAAIGGAVTVTLAVRAWRRSHASDAVEETSVALQEARMDDEGGVVGMADTGNGSLGAASASNN